MKVTPSQDSQFSHHLETLMLGLTHDGRFEEARKLKAECEGYKFTQKMPWFRMHLAERAWDDALKLAAGYRKSDKITYSYLTALVYLKKGEAARAAPEVAVLQQAYGVGTRTDKTLESRLWETQGMLMCLQGQADGGLKLLQKLVERTKDDYRHHAWGNGAVYMEWWGAAALRANKLDVAEEAFLEALAHDAGSVRGALGMQVVCERQGRTEEVARFAELAARCWRRASLTHLAAELAALRGADAVTQPTSIPPVKPKTEGQP
jgi:tetratricopeptide (TPR) repeat protein